MITLKAMSKGLGRIERWIQKKIFEEQTRDPNCVLISSGRVGDLFHPGYSDYKVYSNWKQSRAQKLSVVRAMHSFVKKFPQFALMGGQGRKRLFLYDTADPLSVAWAKANVETRGGFIPYCDMKRRLRRLEVH